GTPGEGWGGGKAKCPTRGCWDLTQHSALSTQHFTTNPHPNPPRFEYAHHRPEYREREQTSSRIQNIANLQSRRFRLDLFPRHEPCARVADPDAARTWAAAGQAAGCVWSAAAVYAGGH